jgi:hypothetical protein
MDGSVQCVDHHVGFGVGFVLLVVLKARVQGALLAAVARMLLSLLHISHDFIVSAKAV